MHFEKKIKMSSISVISQNETDITLRMSLYRWQQIQRLEETYRLARAIRRGLKQAETAPALSSEEAISELAAL